MCRKIQCDEKSWKVFGFWRELNKALTKEERTTKNRVTEANKLLEWDTDLRFK